MYVIKLKNLQQLKIKKKIKNDSKCFKKKKNNFIPYKNQLQLLKINFNY